MTMTKRAVFALVIPICIVLMGGFQIFLFHHNESSPLSSKSMYSDNYNYFSLENFLESGTRPRSSSSSSSTPNRANQKQRQIAGARNKNIAQHNPFAAAKRPIKSHPKPTTTTTATTCLENKIRNVAALKEQFFREEYELRKERFLEEHGNTREEVFVDESTWKNSSTEQPWFVLHIGPPKTATTAIQCGLERHSLRLAKTDGYHYLGGGCSLPNNFYVMPSGETNFLRKQIIFTLHMYRLRRRDCDPTIDEELYSHELHFSDFVKRLRYLRSKGRSVVVSGEQFGSQLSQQKLIMKRVRSMIISPYTKSESLQYDGGAGFAPSKVRIVLAYRHFVDWLPSFHYQTFFKDKHYMDYWWVSNSTKIRRKRVVPFLAYAEEYLSNWEAYQKDLVAYQKTNQTTPDHLVVRTPSGHHTILPKDRQAIHPSWWLYNLWSAYFPSRVQVYDMHSPMNMNRPNEDMVTDFVCHMLPSASKTCRKLMRDADHAATNTSNANTNANAAASGEDTIDFEDPKLHARFSYLHPNQTFGSVLNIIPTTATADSDGNGSGSNKDESKPQGGMQIRPSSDHHASRVVETLLDRGDIRYFNYDNYGETYFEQNADAPTDEVGINAYTKPQLVELVQRLLELRNIHPRDSKNDDRFPETYFDCMSPELEERLLAASRTFMDLMYTHTPLLSLATAATFRGSNTLGGDDEETDWSVIHKTEKEKRWAEAKVEHERLFAKNKAKGKYCDINPDKIFKHHPDLYTELKSLLYKPSFLKFEWKNLTPAQQDLARELLLGKKLWTKKSSVLLLNPQTRKLFGKEWKDLGAKHKAAAFELGWNEATWNARRESVLMQEQQNKQIGTTKQRNGA